jgi:pimeloyl-ACP methyl ester carboxylesterase
MHMLSLMRSAAFATLMLASVSASAQALSDLKPSGEPLVLQSQGSFFVGGRTVETKSAGWSDMKAVFGESFEAGKVLVDQMYVQFQTPPKPSHTPIVFMHGGLLSSKQWETTPDGRMGWYEYFTRQGFPTYMAEQSGRARSGFNATIFNQVRGGNLAPSKQPRVYVGTSNMTWKVFRFGPKLGESYPDQQYPLDHVDAFYKQVIPDMFETQVPSLLAELVTPETKNPTVENFADLAQELGGAILVGHSQSAGFPTQAVLKNKGGIKGIIQLETGCFSNLTDDQVKILAKVPILVMVGDYLGEHPDAACVKEMDQIKAAGGDMTFISLPDVGIKGNSHMFMQDKNNLEVADLIIKWVSEHVDKK